MQVVVVSEMEPWQKVLLLTSYPDLREHLDPLTMVDDLIRLGIIEPAHRETLQRLNRLERNGWFLWHIVLHDGTEQCYNSFMRVLKQNEPRIFQLLKDKEDSFKTGISKTLNQIKCYFPSIYCFLLSTQ